MRGAQLVRLIPVQDAFPADGDSAPMGALNMAIKSAMASRVLMVGDGMPLLYPTPDGAGADRGCTTDAATLGDLCPPLLVGGAASEVLFSPSANMPKAFFAAC